MSSPEITPAEKLLVAILTDGDMYVDACLTARGAFSMTLDGHYEEEDPVLAEALRELLAGLGIAVEDFRGANS